MTAIKVLGKRGNAEQKSSIVVAMATHRVPREATLPAMSITMREKPHCGGLPPPATLPSESSRQRLSKEVLLLLGDPQTTNTVEAKVVSSLLT